MKRILRIFTVVVAFALAGPAAAQDIQGTIDLDKSVEYQIQQLEQMVGGDAKPQFQAAANKWLIELYGYLGRDDDVERCYRRILAVFPNDVGTLNNFAGFLMDRRGDLARADKTLSHAYAWGKASDAAAIDLGTTLGLRAEVRRRTGDYETSVGMAGKALELLSEEGSPDAIRTMAQSQLALERYDDAADSYLRVIAIDRATNKDDVNALQLFASKTARYSDGSLQRHIDDAVAGQHEREAARIELEGGALVTLRASDGVPLEGTLRDAAGPGAVLFVHETGSRRSVFTPYAQLLFIDEISSLSFDLRGHGGSRTDSMLTFDELSPYNRDQLVGDVVAAYRYLESTLSLGDGHIAIIAEGHACAIVEKALYREHLNAPVAYLSPTFADTDLELRTAMAFHAARPVLLVGGREDWSTLKSFQEFTGGRERSGTYSQLYDNAGHGVEMLLRVPAALENLQQWLRGTVGSG